MELFEAPLCPPHILLQGHDHPAAQPDELEHDGHDPDSDRLRGAELHRRQLAFSNIIVYIDIIHRCYIGDRCRQRDGHRAGLPLGSLRPLHPARRRVAVSAVHTVAGQEREVGAPYLLDIYNPQSVTSTGLCST